MHPPELRRLAQRLHADGVRFSDICERLGLPKGTVSKWLYGERRARLGDRPTCVRCQETPAAPPDPAAYAYLLGQYLGDGHIVLTQRVPLLSIYCDDRYPMIMGEVGAALSACGAKTVGRRQLKGCVAVRAYSMHWVCLFPQAGPGKKHERVIALEPWQQAVADSHPGPLLRGLFHSDGCRTANRINKAGKAYMYPRYFFNNRSEGVLDICRTALDRLDVAYTMARRDSLSVARRSAVARLDRWVGPKA